MSDANLEVRFSASIDDLTKGVAEVKDALADLAASASQMNGQYASLGASIVAAMSPDKLRAFDAALLSSVRQARIAPHLVQRHNLCLLNPVFLQR